jgi:hypothetical protein
VATMTAKQREVLGYVADSRAWYGVSALTAHGAGVKLSGRRRTLGSLRRAGLIEGDLRTPRITDAGRSALGTSKAVA